MQLALPHMIRRGTCVRKCLNTFLGRFSCLCQLGHCWKTFELLTNSKYLQVLVKDRVAVPSSIQMVFNYCRWKCLCIWWALFKRGNLTASRHAVITSSHSTLVSRLSPSSLPRQKKAGTTSYKFGVTSFSKWRKQENGKEKPEWLHNSKAYALHTFELDGPRFNPHRPLWSPIPARNDFCAQSQE